MGFQRKAHGSAIDWSSGLVHDGSRETHHVPGSHRARHRGPFVGGGQLEGPRRIRDDFDLRLHRKFAQARVQGRPAGSERAEDTRGVADVGRRPGPVVEGVGVVCAFEQRAEDGHGGDFLRLDGDSRPNVARLGALIFRQQPDRDARAGEHLIGQSHEAQGGELGGQDLDRNLHPDPGVVRPGESRRGAGGWRKRHQGVPAGSVGADHPRVGDADIGRVQREEEHPRPGVHAPVRGGDRGRDAPHLSHPKLQRLRTDRELPLLTRRQGGEADEDHAERQGVRNGRKNPLIDPLERHRSRVSQEAAPRPRRSGSIPVGKPSTGNFHGQ